MRKKDSSYLMK